MLKVDDMAKRKKPYPVFVEVIEASVSPEGRKIATLKLVYPRMIHQELLTHRVFSRNSSSSRAIPTKKLILDSKVNMVYPLRWGRNKSGMQADNSNLSAGKAFLAQVVWGSMAAINRLGVRLLNMLGVHKQWANRPLEWFSTITVLVTSTEWENFLSLRNHGDAQPEMELLAMKMKKELERAKYQPLNKGEWHLPYITKDEREAYSIEDLIELSVARCARVSYLNFDNVKPKYHEDKSLFSRLVDRDTPHLSPTEHQATPIGKDEASGNFVGWRQNRKIMEVGGSYKF